MVATVCQQFLKELKAHIRATKGCLLDGPEAIALCESKTKSQNASKTLDGQQVMPLHLLMGETTISAATEEGQSQITESLPAWEMQCLCFLRSKAGAAHHKQVATGILFSAFQGSGGNFCVCWSSFLFSGLHLDPLF